jgi:hypothetical protein
VANDVDVRVADGKVVLDTGRVVVEGFLDLPVEDDVDGDAALGEVGEDAVDAGLGEVLDWPLEVQFGGKEPVVDENFFFGGHHADVDLLEVVGLVGIAVDEEADVVALEDGTEGIVGVDLLDRGGPEAGQETVEHVEEDKRVGHADLEGTDVHFNDHDVVVEEGDPEVLGVEVIFAEGGVFEVVFGDVADALVGGDQPALEPGSA